MWLNLRTEYSFGAVLGTVQNVAKRMANDGAKAAGIADLNGTWGHIPWAKACKANGLKPVFGVRLAVVERLDIKERRLPFDMMTFVALDNKGLKLLYTLVDYAHRQFYYKPRISYKQVNDLKEKHIAVIGTYSPRVDLLNRHFYMELSPSTPLAIRGLDFDWIASSDNWFINEEDVTTYEPFADDRKRERKTSAQHILTDKEWKRLFPKRGKARKNRDKLLKMANASLPTAEMVKYNQKADMNKMCRKGAEVKGIDLTDPVYKARYKREMDLIKKKGYVDYFLVVADAIDYAKKHMLVGHSRGSSAGSLVCYLLSITEIDPIPYNLVFERFIDINREDLPDIDIDFQMDKRHLVIKYLQRKYGRENVAQLGNVNRLQPKSALARFAKAMRIPEWEIDEIKDAIVETSTGDARAAFAITDTLESTDIGKEFIKHYPQMLPVANVENHASHTGVHAAGILVCNNPITDYCGVNSRGNERIAMLNKKDAEHINLLKIDALGLRTLTILAEVCDTIGMKYSELYTLPLTNKKAYRVFNQNRFTGLFQFEGDAVRSLAKQMPVKSIEDISALGALGRPGPLATGGAEMFVKRRAGKEKLEYISDHPIIIEETKDTYGVIIYQEQVMTIGRNYGGLSWEDVSELRKAMSKSLGDEFFGKYKKKFIKGAIKKGAKEKDAEKVWKNINSMGSWSFNKSHAVSYGMITYLTAYFKANHPLEFAVASLNNSKTDRSALKLLRDLKENEGIDYTPFSKKHSKAKWSSRKGKLIGGYLSLANIGPVKANQAIANSQSGNPNPAGIQKAIDALDTPFRYLYPAKEMFGHIYKKPKKYGIIDVPVSTIINLKKGEVCIIGCLVKKVVRDANEAILVSRRGKTLSGPTAYINLTFEDDTESCLAAVGRFDYEELGKDIAETGKIDKDWYLIYGNYDKEWNKIQIKNIRRLTDGNV